MKLNVKQLLRERQVLKPHGFLVKNGFKKHEAVALLKDKADRIQFKHLSQLCRILWCTPDQLFVLDKAEEKAPLPPNHPLHKLQARTDAPDIIKKLRQLPLEKLEELGRFLEEGK